MHGTFYVQDHSLCGLEHQQKWWKIMWKHPCFFILNLYKEIHHCCWCCINCNALQMHMHKWKISVYFELNFVFINIYTKNGIVASLCGVSIFEYIDINEKLWLLYWVMFFFSIYEQNSGMIVHSYCLNEEQFFNFLLMLVLTLLHSICNCSQINI